MELSGGLFTRVWMKRVSKTKIEDAKFSTFLFWDVLNWVDYRNGLSLNSGKLRK